LPPATPLATIPPERLAIVDQARQAWIRKLIDLSRRNNLLYFRELKVGTLDLSSAEPEAMRALLQSGKANDDGIPLSRLLPPGRQSQAAASLRGIADRARANFEERGLDTLFLALGLATWTADDEGRSPCAPVLLLPLKAAQTGSRSGTWSVARAGELKVNDVLLHALQAEHGVAVSADNLVSEILGDDEGEAFDLDPVFDRLRREASRVPGFDVQRRWVLGNFSFQKLAIVRDLTELLQELARHDIVAGIAGDQTAAELARGSRMTVDPQGFDQAVPDQEFLVRDADASQQQAIAATVGGQSGVISGPPGTGKSQTISNLIAELAARGKTVLFVAEKRAALDVVLNRLNELDLGHLCLDLHGADISRRLVARQLQESLTRVREAIEPATAGLHARFVDRRNALNEHVRRMHTPRPPSGLTVYQIYGRLLQIPESATSTTRFGGPALERLDERTLGAARGLIREAAGLAILPLSGISEQIAADLETPLAKQDRRLRLRGLTVKGAMDLEWGVLAAERDWPEVRLIARELRDASWENPNERSHSTSCGKPNSDPGSRMTKIASGSSLVVIARAARCSEAPTSRSDTGSCCDLQPPGGIRGTVKPSRDGVWHRMSMCLCRWTDSSTARTTNLRLPSQQSGRCSWTPSTQCRQFRVSRSRSRVKSPSTISARNRQHRDRSQRTRIAESLTVWRAGSRSTRRQIGSFCSALSQDLVHSNPVAV
jgi:hypothetical protein